MLAQRKKKQEEGYRKQEHNSKQALKENTAERTQINAWCFGFLLWKGGWKVNN